MRIKTQFSFKLIPVDCILIEKTTFHLHFFVLSTYIKQKGVSVCLFVCLSLLSSQTDMDQTWHGPPPGPWECPPHTFLGVPPAGGI